MAFDVRIKGLKKARGMSEMRDAGDRWESVETIHAAAGVKIIAQGLEKALAGSTIRLASDEARNEAKKETQSRSNWMKKALSSRPIRSVAWKHLRSN